MKDQNEIKELTGNVKDFPITHGKLVNLMKHVDDSFPEFPRQIDDVLSIQILGQYFWQRRQEWMTCLEELADILATPILTQSQMYFISDEFRDSDDAKQGA